MQNRKEKEHVRKMENIMNGWDEIFMELMDDMSVRNRREER